MMNVVGAWMNSGLAAPGVFDRANERARRVLVRHLVELPEPPATEFPPEINGQSAVIEGYLALASLLTSFRDCEHYFRRYPFADKSVSRADHLRNCCEMYCDHFAQFRDRMKATLNAANKLGGTAPVKNFLKAFDESFPGELRMRNHVHHHGRFDDDAIRQLSMIELLNRFSKEGDVPLPNPQNLYRRASKEWIQRVQSRSEHLTMFLEEVAGVLLGMPFVQPFRQVPRGAQSDGIPPECEQNAEASADT
jgi:hypothetical protein